MRKLILSALILASAFQTALGEQDGDWTYYVENNQAVLTRYTGPGGAVTIPSVAGGIPVVKIGPAVFNTLWEGEDTWLPNLSVTSITITVGIIIIDSWAFHQCINLINVTIPATVTAIETGAFYACSQLVRVNFEGNAPSFIGSHVFSGTSATIYIQEGTTGWSNPLAGRPTNQEWEYTIVNGEAIITRYKGLGGMVSVPQNLTGYPVASIADQAFSNRTEIYTITIPNGVMSIGSNAFSGCSSLTSITIPNSVTSIGGGAFGGCPLTTITMPDRFIAQVAQIGIGGQVATDYLVNALANNDAFVTAVANKIKATGGNYGIATQSGLSSAIATAVEPLATKSEITTAINEGKASGIASVTASPNTWSLFTTSQIQNMAVGDLVLTRQVSGGFVLNYDIEQSTDLQTWTPYQALSLPLTGLPTDKAFVRIKVKQEGVSNSSSSQATPTTDMLPPYIWGGGNNGSGRLPPDSGDTSAFIHD